MRFSIVGIGHQMRRFLGLAYKRVHGTSIVVVVEAHVGLKRPIDEFEMPNY